MRDEDWEDRKLRMCLDMIEETVAKLMASRNPATRAQIIELERKHDLLGYLRREVAARDALLAARASERRDRAAAGAGASTGYGEAGDRPRRDGVG